MRTNQMARLEQIVIAGGSGFLGNLLSDYFQSKGHDVRILTRSPKKENEVYWDAKELGDWTVEIEWATVLINLTGKSVDCRYTEKNKRHILESRVDSTKILARAIQRADIPPRVWLNAASATIYVHSENRAMTEDEGVIGADFSMNVCKAWEAAFFMDDLAVTRRVALRTSIVLGNNGGAFPQLKRLAKFGMAGKQGNGEQYVSWIHAIDFCRAVEFVMTENTIVGPVNIVAPQPEKNKNFMLHLRKTMKLRIGFNQSKWLLELGAALIGTESELLLKSRFVIPERLNEFGFKFEFNTLDKCLKNLINH